MSIVTEEPWVSIARAPQDGRPPRIVAGPYPGADEARRRKRDFERATGKAYALRPVARPPHRVNIKCGKRKRG